MATKPTGSVTVTTISDDPSECIVDVESLQFNDENWNVTQIVTVTGVPDDLVDGTQLCHILVSSKTSEDDKYAALEDQSVNVNNLDKTVAGITISPDSGIITNENGSTGSVSVVLNSKPASEVKFVITNDSKLGQKEGKLLTSEILFTPENWNVPQSISVQGLDDKIADGDQTYSLTLNNAISDDEIYQGKFTTEIRVINVDDETPGIAMNAPDVLAISESGDTATFSIVLNSEPTDDVTIKMTNSNAGKVKLDVNEVVFTKDNYSTPVTVTVSAIDDDIENLADELKFAIDFEITTSDTIYQKMKLDTLNGTITDNDHAGVTVSNTKLSTSEDGTSGVFTVALTSEPTSTVTISLNGVPAKEGTLDKTSLTFDKTNWKTAQTVTVTGVDDLVADGDILYSIELAAASQDAKYHEIKLDSIEVVNTDNEKIGVTVTPKTLWALPQSEIFFEVSLISQPLSDVTISIVLPDQAIIATNTTKLTFTPENWNQPQKVNVTANSYPNEKTVNILTLEKTVSDSKIYNEIEVDDVTVNIINFDHYDFAYTGSVQKITLYPAKYSLEVWGAQGGNSIAIGAERQGAPGGYSTGIVEITEQTDVFVYVGGKGLTGTSAVNVTGGFNGGGYCPITANGTKTVQRGSGGGATDMRLITDSLYSRVIVAGGGGGAAGTDTSLGSCKFTGSTALGIGGGANGGKGENLVCDSNIRYGGEKGTQTAGGIYGLYNTQTSTASSGTFGVGGVGGTGTNNFYPGGGGGGGWFGGGGGAMGGGDGGGGSAWLHTKDNVDAGITASSVIGGTWLLTDKHYLTSASTSDGNASITDPDGSTVKGHYGNGFARIS